MALSLLLTRFGLHIKCGVEGIKVSAVQFILRSSQTFTEPLIVNHLPLPEELNRLAHIIVLDNAENIVIGGSGFLLCRHILMKIRNYIPLGLKLAGIKGNSSGRLGPDRRSMVNIIRAKALFYQLFGSQVSGELMNDGGNNFKMRQFLCTW